MVLLAARILRFFSIRTKSLAKRFESSACFLTEGILGITYLISRLLSIGGHDVASCGDGQYKGSTSLPEQHRRLDKEQ